MKDISIELNGETRRVAVSPNERFAIAALIFTNIINFNNIFM